MGRPDEVDHVRFEQPDQGEQFPSEYDQGTRNLADLIGRDVAPVFVQGGIDLSTAGTRKISAPGRGFVPYFYYTGTVNKVRAPMGLLNVSINSDLSNSEYVFPAKHNRGFVGTFSEITLSWAAQPGISVDFVIHKSIRRPWMTDEIANVQPPEFDAGISGAAITLTLSEARPTQKVTLNQNSAITLAGTQDGSVYVIHIKEDGVGGWLPTFTNTIKWSGGTPPAAQAANVDMLVIVTQLGTELFGSVGYYT